MYRKLRRKAEVKIRRRTRRKRRRRSRRRRKRKVRGRRAPTKVEGLMERKAKSKEEEEEEEEEKKLEEGGNELRNETGWEQSERKDGERDKQRDGGG